MNTETEKLGDSPPLHFLTPAGHDPGPPARPPLLGLDEHGDLRVRGTRVLLETIVAEYEKGASAEQIADAYDTVSLDDVRGVLRSYQNNRELAQCYLEIQQRRAAESLDRLRAAGMVIQVTREELLARTTWPGGGHASPSS